MFICKKCFLSNESEYDGVHEAKNGLCEYCFESILKRCKRCQNKSEHVTLQKKPLCETCVRELNAQVAQWMKWRCPCCVQTSLTHNQEFATCKNDACELFALKVYPKDLPHLQKCRKRIRKETFSKLYQMSIKV